ncbi:universal stress protein [Salinilacihabitans rarus]|uniref:universal stress protein n=1 Tax=Salinilacihabitans rarus TaxID=2961596 RepID=UPI0020C8AB4A|nr:universal stress protein [Salinilacihabitans rarus]
MMDSILVATDGSDTAGEAAGYAIDLADRLGASLHGISVVETRTAYDNAIVDPEEAEAALRERAREALAALEDAAAAAGVSVETTVERGVPHEEIIAYAEAHDVSTIVVGSSGRSSFRRALLGSTADALVRLSPVPVLVVGDPVERAPDP